MATEVLVEPDVARRLVVGTYVIPYGIIQPPPYGKACFDGGLVTRHEGMIIVGLTVAEAVVPARQRWLSGWRRLRLLAPQRLSASALNLRIHPSLDLLVLCGLDDEVLE